MNAQAIKTTRIRSMPMAALHKIATSDPNLSFTLYRAIAVALVPARHGDEKCRIALVDIVELQHLAEGEDAL